MFVHSGASLHGHEFSHRAIHAVTGPGNLRNPLLRSTLSPGPNIAPNQPRGQPVSADIESDMKESTIYSDATSETLHVFRKPRSDASSSQSECLSEDESSILSDDGSKASSSLHRKRRSRVRRGTTYVLAHPPPKPWTKQRMIILRPNLVLQIQTISHGSRPKPIIDVYPLCPASKLILARLLKCSHPITGIKKELSIHDIMLVRSEDYASQSSGSENDDDEDDTKARDVVAVVSPSKTEDKAEIVMADGAIWVATTRAHGNTFSYEFTSDVLGRTVTARWVRRHNVPGSIPATPTSQGPNGVESHLMDSKFTFSFIDPNYRRHPILATMTRTSLTIPETYTTISRSNNQSQLLSRSSSPNEEKSQGERRTRILEEWQKSVISISAIWVALRNGWAPSFRPPFSATVAPQVEGHILGHRRSVTVNNDFSPASTLSEATGPRKAQHHTLQFTNKIPHRVASIGANHMRSGGLALQGNEDMAADGDSGRTTGLSRRALSGDWNVGLSKRMHTNSLAEYVSPTTNESQNGRSTALAPPPIPVEFRVVSTHAPLDPLPSSDVDEKPHEAPTNTREVSRFKFKCRRCRWKNMGNWIRKRLAR